MNADAIKKRLEEYYRTATPEKMIAEFEAMGVEFVDIQEPFEVKYDFESTANVMFNNESRSWFDNLSIKQTEEAYSMTTQTKVAGHTNQSSGQQVQEDFQCAMAA
ncbi:MAG: hypothetical protein WCR52_00095 [Bacteroidota bacterium]|uniref:hypothetical protein n=1 Tax=Runella sp. TaxID=1960881 RepID=UPI003017042C